ncbi:type I methionyl aminopeptidase [Chloracidobacterium aggregatum]|jgi:methionyl aminopeptidase|uniref:Methionine aminopeptidase n=1 Tax=Chloracidobacterium sp. N TaxID=2821540 RepID=A0ABX8AWW2_9BACT|nr:type I methionyl aminopeptidase [Chloracidobacterium aggregatum]QUV84454.1 type I methionyl aminopeptidase [Chloracidobacterium sp. 2]QUV87052.1 type I methionyl aminopeptidase [Chloracidobacterium sp. S]QUV89962.1 type I methionyl aminopeptidase [Chloracidobacterium sp. A]QUV93173.1 type I methionyl aminopeptidase [Chloracidobacterium sp. N]QUV96328.1 type I methionyl aminopeptidase [Chloracidobacterium sp. E]
MITTKTRQQIERMHSAGKYLAELLALLKETAVPGITTARLNEIAEGWLVRKKLYSPFKGYRGYPSSICVSVNEQVVHGIPGQKLIKNGDIVSIDAGVVFDGYVADAAITIPVGEVSEQLQKLISITNRSLYYGISQMVEGNRLYDITYAIQSYTESYGYSLVKEFCGHGVGRKMHEDPQVPNCGHRPNTGPRLRSGWVLAIEPMVNMGSAGVKIESDGWTVVTNDGKPSAHFEHTVAITPNGPLILTAL